MEIGGGPPEQLGPYPCQWRNAACDAGPGEGERCERNEQCRQQPGSEDLADQSVAFVERFGNLHVQARIRTNRGDSYRLAVVIRVEESTRTRLEVWRGGQILVPGHERPARAANLEHQRVFVIVEQSLLRLIEQGQAESIGP